MVSVAATAALSISWWFMVHLDAGATPTRYAAAMASTLLAFVLSVGADVRDGRRRAAE